MFSASKYLARMEQVVLDILENAEPIDKTITLWWGLDGIRLNEDGATEWINRRERNFVAENVFYQMCQPIQPMRAAYLLNGQMQNTKAQIDAVMAQNATLQIQSRQMENAFQQCCVQYPAQYPSYYYSGCCRID